MRNEYAIDLSQDIANKLTEYANIERAKLLPRNEYKTGAFEYSTTNPNAIADGDSQGRGTGVFLDVLNDKAGTSEDIVERKNMIKINKFNKSNTYPDF